MKFAAPNVRTTRAHATLPIEELRINGSRERLIDTASGQFNASSREDLIRSIMSLANMVQSGQTETSSDRNSRKRKEEAAARRLEVSAAYNDRTGSSWAEMGAAVANQLSITANRDGFARRLLLREDVAQGTIPRIRVRQFNVLGSVAGDVGNVSPQIVRDKYLLPPEFYISANLRVEEREIAQGTGDVLEEKFFEGNEAIMIAEDRTWKKMVDSVIGTENPQQALVGGMTPNNLAYMRQLIVRWGLPTSKLLIAADTISDLTGTNFSTWYDPVSQYEIVLTGMLGNLEGMSIITDAYREPRQKVLNQGEIYLVSSPEYHGAYTDRGEVQSTPQDNYMFGGPARGWYMYELISMVIANARSVVKGVRS